MIVTHLRLLQFVWAMVGPTFLEACPEPLRKALRVNMSATRVSINLINNGLPFHRDNVIPHQPDPTKSAPGISISVHLGAPDDSVFLGFRHGSHQMHEIKPGMLALFPGYLLEHKTVRPKVVQPAQRRYSVVLFLQFKRELATKTDKYLRESYSL